MRDLLIIGGGPAGYEAAIRAAQFGINVTVIEKNRLGGTCLNIGCVPTKCLLSDVAKGRELKLAYDRKVQVVNKLVDGIEKLFKAHKINLISGTAKFIDKNAVEIFETGEKLSFDSAILATGSVPFIPKSLQVDGFTVDSDYLLTNSDLIDKEVIVVGGGVIGVEASYILKHVTIVEKMPQILPAEDLDMVRSIERELKKRGIKIYTGLAVDKVSKGQVVLEDGTVISADKMLVVIGRKPNTDGLNLDKAGISLTDKGFVVVDDDFRTTNPSVYAAGDVIGQAMLAHYASAVAKNIVAKLVNKPQINTSVIPSVVYSTPELARVGKTEKDLKTSNIDYRVGKFMYGANARALASEELGTVKILTDPDGKILGASILGAGAENMISTISVVMANNGTVHDISRTIFPHPTLGEVILEAAEDTEGLSIHKFRR